jgi:hypothetical protein
MSEIEKIKQENNNDINTNIEENFKLNFDFDILNEPMPDFTELQKGFNNSLFLNKNKFAYKRKYNEIKDEGDHFFPKGPKLKLK